MDRPMIDLAADLISLSPLLESSRTNEKNRNFEHLGLFKDLNSIVKASLEEVPLPPKVEPLPAQASGTPQPSAAIATPKATATPTPPPRRAAVNPLHEALRLRAAQRLRSMSSSRILRPKPLP